jgi:hypothetical protein
MPMKALKFKPGIISDITSYSNEGGFVDGDKVRFRFGFPEKFGGWEKYSPNQYLGSARRLHNWVALDGSDFMGIGTHLKYYIEEGQTFNDITPIRNTTSAGDVTFSATNGSSLISSNAYTITSSVAANSSDTGNGGGSVVGAYQINVGLDVTVGGTGWGAGQWSGTTSGALATQLNEALDASETDVDVDDETGMNTANDVILIDNELMLVSATSDDNTMTVTRGHSGTDAATHADNTLVRLAVGNADSANDFVGWGNAASVTVPGAQIRLWSHDNFGEDIIINPRDGGLFYWDKTNGLGTRAVELSATSTYSGETSVPTIAKQVLVSDQDRHVIVFGCDGLGANSSATQGDGVQDPLLIRFSSQENPVDFFPTATNTAGDLRLGGGSTFVQAVETKQQILVFTNKTLHAMKFIGPPFTFGLQELSKNITIMSPFSAIAVEDAVFWMGVDTFYVYSGGQTIQLPCTVKDKVFLDFNFEERDKVHVGLNSEFSEILWFYPSSAGTTVDKYVAYNYLEKSVWYYGTLARQAWLDRGIRNLPQATGNQYLYNHEVGFDDDGSAMTSFIESSAIDIGDGDKFLFIKQVIPDITFNGSTSVNPDIAFTMKSRNNPGANFNETTQATTQRSATSPVEQFTEKLNYRLRGRSFALRIDSTSLGTKYKLGTPRIDIREDGRR